MRLKQLLCLLLALVLPSSAALAATEELSGTVVAGYEVSVSAPFGGSIASMSLRQGEWVNEGDVLAGVRTTRVVATTDGTVRGVYAVPGDSVQGTVLTIAPVSKYTITATVTQAYISTDTKYVVLGETVYIKCTADGSHVAVGRITAVNGSQYTVQTTGGELYMEESVYLYRSSDYSSTSRIGRGTVARTEEVPIQASGSIVRMHVEDGEEVERGQLLFETVEGNLDSLTAVDNNILATTAGVVASVLLQTGDSFQKGDTIATIYPRDGYQLAVTVPEDMITRVNVGDTLRFYLEWNEANPQWYEGVVSSLSYASTTTALNTTTFTAYLDFEADETVRLGMSAVVELTD